MHSSSLRWKTHKFQKKSKCILYCAPLIDTMRKNILFSAILIKSHKKRLIRHGQCHCWQTFRLNKTISILFMHTKRHWYDKFFWIFYIFSFLFIFFQQFYPCSICMFFGVKKKFIHFPFFLFFFSFHSIVFFFLYGTHRYFRAWQLILWTNGAQVNSVCIQDDG